jgi:hypothetical protein
MADGNSLEALVSSLKRVTEETSNAVKNIAQKQLGANEALKGTLDTQTRLSSEVETIQKNLQSITDGQENLRHGMVDRLIELKGQLADVDRQINSHSSGLKTLLEGQSKENARIRIEHERGQILVQMRSLLGEMKDGAVSYIFSSRGLSSLAIQGVVPSAFQGLSDKSTADQIFRDLKRIRDGVSDKDRQEAEKFESIDRFLNEIMNCHSAYRSAKQKFNTQRTSMQKNRDDSRRSILELEQKLKEASQKKGGVFVSLGFPVIALILFVAAFAVRQIEFLVISIILFSSWLVFLIFRSFRRNYIKHSNERDVKRISDMNKIIRLADETIEHILLGETLEDTSALQSIILYRKRIANFVLEFKNRGLVVNIDYHKTDTLTVDDSLDECIKAAKALRDAWIANHPDMKRVGGLV